MVETPDLAQASPRVGFSRGVVFALAAAVLFGAGMPLAKVLLSQVDPGLLAGLLYGGSGCGVVLAWRLRFWLTEHAAREASLKQKDLLGLQVPSWRAG
jgi:drug/metabolite transporter (DMT)-like permease